MNTRAFHHRLSGSLTRCLGKNKSIVCAVSGGIDSVVLLHALNELNRRKRLGLSLHVAHVDHGLRVDSTESAAWVGRLAASMALPFAHQRVNVPGLVRRGGVSLEEAARKARYAALEEMALGIDSTCVAVAHHANDQAETVLHHVLRGTGLIGLGGMPASRAIRLESPIQLIRPLLGFTRGDIEAYAREQGLAHFEDTTNTDTSLTRNRIRHELLPQLADRFNPRVVEALNRLADQARAAGHAISERASIALSESLVGIEPGIVQLECERLNGLPSAVVGEVLRITLNRLGAPMQSIDHERLTAMRELLAGEGRRRTVELPCKYAAQRRGRYLLIGEAKIISGKASTAARSLPRPRRAAARRR